MTRRARAFFVTAGLAGMLGSLGGCFIDAKIGDDPESDAGTTGDPGEETETTTSTGPEPGTVSATTTGGSPGSASATSTTSTTGGDPSASASATSAGPDPGVDQDTALQLCGIEVVPLEPGSPVYYEGVECSDGCSIDIVTSVPTNLYEHGECLCAAIACGEPTGGTTSDGGDIPIDTDTDTGEPDGCGPFPDGNAGFTCSCEMCSIDVDDVDAAWLEGEADLEAICECMCGGAGCGAPV